MTVTAERERTIIPWAGIALALVIAQYVWLATFANPGADDLTYALDTRRDGYWVALRDQYFLWNGRYASNLFELGGPMVLGSIALYKVVAFLTILATLLAAYAFIRTLVGDAWTASEVATSALGLTGVFLGGVPALGETIYWYTGAVTYQWSAIMLLLLASLIIGVMRESSRRAATRGAAAVVLTIVVVGMNEVALALTVGFLGAVLAVALGERRRRVAIVAGLLLAVALACGLVVALAPGNAVRSAMFPLRHQLMRSVVMTLIQTLRFGALWSTSGTLLLASLLYLPLCAHLVRRSPIRDLGRGRNLCLLGAGTIGVIALAVFPAYWASGELGQHRTVSVAYFLFLPLWFMVLTAALAGGWLPSPDRWLSDRRVQTACFILLILSLALTGNGQKVTIDLVYGRSAAFDRATAERFAVLRRCVATPQIPCAIAPITVKPDVFLLPDISTDPNDWVNAAYASYFGIRQVVRAVP